jgi:hypothetical protein
MTTVIIARSDSPAPTTVPITLIATLDRVNTVRYDTPTYWYNSERPFRC